MTVFWEASSLYNPDDLESRKNVLEVREVTAVDQIVDIVVRAVNRRRSK